MADNDKKSVGKDILDGIRNISEEYWNRAMTEAKESEKREVSWMAAQMKKEMDEKTDSTEQPTSESKEL